MVDLMKAAWRAEEALLNSGVRSAPDRLTELLAPNFYEIGQSGRRWSRDEIIAALVGEPESEAQAALTEREARLITPEVVLLSYRLEYANRTSRRSSLWRWSNGTIQCFFHQGTPLPPA